MQWRRRGVPSAAVALVLGICATLLAGGPAVAGDDQRPTVDPSAPTPTSPYPGRPPQGHAPGGGTIGGAALDTRGLVVADGAPPLPDGLTAAGWLVADAGTGDVLAARDPHGRYYPASTLKTLTLLTLVPLLDPARVVVGTAEDSNVEGSRVGLVEGGQYPVSLLFQALILQSGNDAANALARAAGGVDVTVAAMNETAQSIGAFDTIAGTPSGLDVVGQSSSPYDLALIFRALIADPATAAVLATPTAQMPAVEGRSPGYQIQSQNPLRTTYAGDLGSKTGFTDAARHTFVTAAERNGRRLVVSLMDSENMPLRPADQPVRLLDWGFALPAGTKGVGTLVTPAEVAASPSATGSSTPVASRHAASGAASADPAAGFPVVPVVLGGTALLIVAATVAGRRRAVRPVPTSRGRSGEAPVKRPSRRRPAEVPAPPPPTGESPSTPP
jgi:serine-type D-Ala-D-Ala carboxypeptidase (penicillin-binding protein 5/6)